MKIIHLGGFPVPPKHATAKTMAYHQGRWALNHAVAQKRAGMDVEAVTIAHKAEHDFTYEIDGVKCHFLRTFHPYRHFTFYALDSWRLARLARRLGADIVHAHGTEEPYALGAVRSGLPFCITTQGLYFQIIPALGGKPDWNMRFLRMIEHAAWKRAKFAIAKSEYVRAALAAEYPHLDLTLIPNTYAPELDDGTTNRPGEFQIKPGKHLAFVGTVVQRKGFHIIAEAMRTVATTHPDAVLHVVGNAPEGSGSAYSNEQIASLRQTLGDRLILHGNVHATNVFEVLDTCRILLAPSLEEMFGNQLIEGLMRGCFGIVAEGTALAENARRFGNCAVVPQNDAAALAAAINTELSHPWQGADSATARGNIRARMSPEIVAAKHKLLYERIFCPTRP